MPFTANTGILKASNNTAAAPFIGLETVTTKFSRCKIVLLVLFFLVLVLARLRFSEINSVIFHNWTIELMYDSNCTYLQ